MYEQESPKIEYLPETTIPAKEVLVRLQEYYKLSSDYVREKRQSFRERYKLYNNQRKDKRKIGITSIYTMMNALLAVSYTDELTVAFGQRHIQDADSADRWEKLARFDYEEMSMERIDYVTKWNSLFYGVGIRVLNEWDSDSDTPLPRVMDPFSWLPDPKADGIMMNHRYHGFEIEASVDDVTEENGYFNLSCLKGHRPSDELQNTRNMQDDAHGMGTVYGDQTYQKSVHNLIDWFFSWKVDGVMKKFLATTDGSCGHIVRFQELKPKTNAEKKNPAKVPFPVILNYYSPEPGNPFGVSVPDLTEDKQRAQSIMANLRIAVERSRLYPMYLYDKTRILNRRDLDFGFNKLIGVPGPVDEGIVRPMQRDTKQLGQTLTMEQSLQAEAERATGAGPTQQGVMNDTARTLGEIQQVQANANLRFMLSSSVYAWGEKFFWQLWMRCYEIYFEDGKEKIIDVTSSIGSNYLVITKSKLACTVDPRVRIVSKLQHAAEREKARVEFASVIPQLLQDPTIPLVSKNFARRHLFRLHNIDQEQIDILVPKTPDEMDAEMENELLVRNMMTEIEAEDDHLSHIVIHSKMQANPATMAHIEAHKKAYRTLGQQAQVNEQMLAGQGGMRDTALQAQSQVSAQAGNQSRSGANMPSMVTTA